MAICLFRTADHFPAAAPDSIDMNRKVAVAILLVGATAVVTYVSSHSDQSDEVTYSSEIEARPESGESTPIGTNAEVAERVDVVPSGVPSLRRIQGAVIAEVRVDFGETDFVDVSLRQFVPATPPYTPRNRLIDAYDGLVKSAQEGNAAAARDLFRELRRCENRFESETDLKKAIESLRSTNQITYPDGSHAHIAEGLSTLEIEEIETEKYQYCVGIDDSAIEGREKWARLAAEGADFLGARDYAQEVGFDSVESYQIYEDLWNRGHISAAQTLSMLSERGFSPESEGQPDRFNAYVFSLISVKTLSSAYDASPVRPHLTSGDVANRKADMDRVLGLKASYLTAEEIKAAESLAAELLRKNENCCLGRW